MTPTGGTSTLDVDLTNTGTSVETITGTTAPSSPFSAGSLPVKGASLAPGASVSVAVTFSPTGPGTWFDSLSVTSDAPGRVTIPLSGTSVAGSGHLRLAPLHLHFGLVAVGRTATRTFRLSDTGNLGLTITKAAPPAGAFSPVSPVSEGQQLTPGEVIAQQVSFTPTALGQVSGTYLLTADTGQGERAVTLTGTGVPAPPPVGSIAGLGSACVDVAGAHRADGTPIQLWTCNRHPAQTWTVASDATLEALGKCMDVAGVHRANRSPVVLSRCDGAAAEHWVPLAGGLLRNPASGRCLTDPRSRTADGTPLFVTACRPVANERWRLPH